METFLDQIDEDGQEYLVRRRRQRRIRRERLRRKRRRCRLKILFCLGILIIPISAEPIFEEPISQEEIPEAEEDIKEAEEEIPVYTFESTEDTASIYSDQVISSHAILIDESTDTIVASKGAKERISPASMTKVLTVLPSGGDAAVGLATYASGSHEAFVDMMNEKLEELGISNSACFTNCAGRSYLHTLTRRRRLNSTRKES